MRYGIDIDGVLADFDSGFFREANLLWPGRVPVGFQKLDWEFIEGGLNFTQTEKDDVWRQIQSKPNWWLSLPAFGNNVRAIATHRIRHPEDELFYVTARVPTKGMPTMHQTQVWLEQCGIGGLGTAVIVDESGDKASIFNALECDANIDDKLEAVRVHNERTRSAFLLDRLWNRKGRQSNIAVVSNLEEFFRKAGIASASI